MYGKRESLVTLVLERRRRVVSASGSAERSITSVARQLEAPHTKHTRPCVDSRGGRWGPGVKPSKGRSVRKNTSFNSLSHCYFYPFICNENDLLILARIFSFYIIDTATRYGDRTV